MPVIGRFLACCRYFADRVKTLFYSGDWRRVTRGGAFCAFWPGKPPVDKSANQCRRGKLSLGIEPAQRRADAGIEEARAAQRYLIAQFAKQFRIAWPVIRWLYL